MFVGFSEYEQLVTSISKDEGEVLVAVAFWGSDTESLFHPRTGQRTKLICNLVSGATNPSVIDAIRNGRSHAKVIVGSKRALVSSANFSSNRLSLEGSSFPVGKKLAC